MAYFLVFDIIGSKYNYTTKKLIPVFVIYNEKEGDKW